MPFLELLFWTENAAFRVAILNRQCRFKSCFFEPKMPPPGLLFWTEIPPLWLLFWTENAAFGVALVNWKYRFYSCFFEPQMPPLGQVPPGAFCPLCPSSLRHCRLLYNEWSQWPSMHLNNISQSRSFFQKFCDAGNIIPGICFILKGNEIVLSK